MDWKNLVGAEAGGGPGVRRVALGDHVRLPQPGPGPTNPHAFSIDDYRSYGGDQTAGSGYTGEGPVLMAAQGKW